MSSDATSAGGWILNTGSTWSYTACTIVAGRVYIGDWTLQQACRVKENSVWATRIAGSTPTVDLAITTLARVLTEEVNSKTRRQIVHQVSVCSVCLNSEATSYYVWRRIFQLRKKHYNRTGVRLLKCNRVCNSYLFPRDVERADQILRVGARQSDASYRVWSKWNLFGKCNDDSHILLIVDRLQYECIVCCKGRTKVLRQERSLGNVKITWLGVCDSKSCKPLLYKTAVCVGSVGDTRRSWSERDRVPYIGDLKLKCLARCYYIKRPTLKPPINSNGKDQSNSNRGKVERNGNCLVWH